MYDQVHNKTVKTSSKHMQDIDHERSSQMIQSQSNPETMLYSDTRTVQSLHIFTIHRGKSLQTFLEVNKCPTLFEAGFTLRGCYLISFTGFTAPIKPWLENCGVINPITRQALIHCISTLRLIFSCFWLFHGSLISSTHLCSIYSAYTANHRVLQACMKP